MISVSSSHGPVMRAAGLILLLLAAPLGARSQTVITGLKSSVTALAFSPNSKTLAATDDSFDLTLWDAATGKAAGKFSGLSTHTNRVGWSPDGKTIYGTTGNEWISWDVATGKQKQLIKAEMTGTAPRCIALSPDGKLIAAAGQGVLKVWETASSKALGEYEPHPNYGIASVSFSPDSRTVCTASSDRSAQLTDAATGKAGPRFTCNRRVLAAEFSPDGKTLFVADEEALLHQFDIASGKDQPAPPLRMNATQLAVSRDGRYVACAGSVVLRIWSRAQNRWLEHNLEDTVVGATAVAISPDGKLLACGDAPERIKIWPLAQLVGGK